MYEEVETKSPGRESAAVYLGIQVGLSQTPLSNDGMREISLSTNTPPPLRKSLQKTSNKVIPMIESMNKADMSDRCHQLVDVNILRGSDSLRAIAVHSDGMYNIITPCTRGWLRHPSSRQHRSRLCYSTHSPKMPLINKKVLKW